MLSMPPTHLPCKTAFIHKKLRLTNTPELLKAGKERNIQGTFSDTLFLPITSY